MAVGFYRAHNAPPSLSCGPQIMIALISPHWRDTWCLVRLGTREAIGEELLGLGPRTSISWSIWPARRWIFITILRNFHAHYGSTSCVQFCSLSSVFDLYALFKMMQSCYSIFLVWSYMLTANKTNKVDFISFRFNHQHILISLPYALQILNQTLLFLFYLACRYFLLIYENCWKSSSAKQIMGESQTT
jgi:hypothetical protein